MESRSRRIATIGPILAGWLACAPIGAGGPARAQTSSRADGPGQGGPSGGSAGSRPDAGASNRAAAGDQRGGQDKAKAGAKARADEKKAAAPAAGEKAARRGPSEEFQESIRKTIEKRRQRRARRAQSEGADDLRPPGAIVPWPLPPALIIRQTPQVHDEIDSLLGQLRRGG